MLPLLLRVAMSLSASWHLTPPSPARVVAAIAAAGGTVAAIAALLALSAPPPHASGAAADSPVESARPVAADDPDIYLGWAEVLEWRTRPPQMDDWPKRRRRHIRTAPDRRSPTVAERQTAEPHRAPPPTNPAPEGASDPTLWQPAAPSSARPAGEFAFAGPHMTAGPAHAADPEEAPSPTPGADVSPEPAPPSEPTPPHGKGPASPPTTVQPPPAQPPATVGPAPGTLPPRVGTPRTPVAAPPVAAPPVTAPVLGARGSQAWPSAPSATSGPSATPGRFVTPLRVMAPLMSDRAFGEDFGNGIDDIVVTSAKGAGHEPFGLFTGPGGPSDGRGGADDLVNALLADDFDPGLGKAFDLSAPVDTIAMAFDVPASSGGNSLAPVVDVQGGDGLRTETLLRPMAIGMIPEPGTAPLLALGLAALVRHARRKSRR